ncbi:hypothetical protein [Thiohalophilus sp.]|uniref:hypothetical protein n=1 Tax=Thiohalophilus sp. TaxID=3028392 RepID=UPI002ACE18F7|nr:hypothetical protein [Thiohalophilus sp.]MDZ7661087.1 hypothetical protein [Thiohalophilus sp.]
MPKTKGVALLAVFAVVFNLAFTGKNTFQGIVKDKKITIGKNAIYNSAESGKRKAESGKRKAESGKRKAESGKTGQIYFYVKRDRF